MDVRNDLDYAPDAKSCEYCHVKVNESQNKGLQDLGVILCLPSSS
jgi:hypothetical protein